MTVIFALVAVLFAVAYTHAETTGLKVLDGTVALVAAILSFVFLVLA